MGSLNISGSCMLLSSMCRKKCAPWEAIFKSFRKSQIMYEALAVKHTVTQKEQGKHFLRR